MGEVMDKITEKQRSDNMRAIHSKDTNIEVCLCKSLWHNGIRYRKNYKICNCHVDIAITKYKIAVFCDGDFWHGKPSKYSVKTNTAYWNEKIKRNIERDLQNTIAIRDAGWIVLRFWESDIKNNLAECIKEIAKAISLRRCYGNFSK